MPHVELEYPKKPYGTVNRYSPRASYALRTIHTIINSASILHVSFTPPESPFPVILPLIGQMGSFTRPSADEGDPLDLYLHGYVSSRIMNNSRSSTVATDGGHPNATPGLPVCIAATHVDGFVLALTPNSHSYNYRSAILFGHATIVEDLSEKLYAMQLITDGVISGRWAQTRVPPNGAEMASTSVLKVTITTGSAKIRSGPPGDEKYDKEDPNVVDRVWTGVVPIYQTLGDVIPGPYNRVGEVPRYLADAVKVHNEVVKDQALEATKTAMPSKKGT